MFLETPNSINSSDIFHLYSYEAVEDKQIR